MGTALDRIQELAQVLGTWRLKSYDLTFTPPRVDDVLQVLSPGGGLVSVSPGSPSTSLGSWRANPDGTLAMRWTEFDFDSGLQYSRRIEGVVTATVTGDTFEGSYTYEVFDAGDASLFKGHGTLEGNRLVA